MRQKNTILKVETDLEKALSPYIISTALPSILRMLERDHVRLDLSDRKTATLGYFRPDTSRFSSIRRPNPLSTMQVISLQKDLNPYALLFVLLHEWAHLVTRKQYGYEVRSHGKEWKKNFREISQPFLHPDIFPQDILEAFRNYFIKTGRFFDHDLQKACCRYGKNREAFKKLYFTLQNQGISIPAPDYQKTQSFSQATESHNRPTGLSQKPTDESQKPTENLKISQACPKPILEITGKSLVKNLKTGDNIELEGETYTIEGVQAPFVLARSHKNSDMIRLHFMVSVNTLGRRQNP